MATSTESDEVDTQDRNEEPNSVELHLDKEQNIAKPSILKWFCTPLAKIAMKHHLTQSAILSICCLISVFLKLISHPLYNVFPTTVHRFWNLVSQTQLKMEEYVVCPNDSCNYLYRFNEAEKCKVCTATIFGKKCGEELGYDKRLAFAKHKWCPHKVYYFIPPSQWLRNMFQQAKFVKLFYSQKKVSSDSNVYHDIYDATIWKEFSSSLLNPSVPFLSDPNNIALLLNVDWFKPFKRSECKVSAIMMTVLNLPREERFKEEWTMVLGVIPGPTEPKRNINTFLKPLVDDLIPLWDGLPLHPVGRNIKAALLGISADMPAMKKVTRFLGHKADYGCSRCLFKAEREQSTRGASGNMSYLTSIAWFLQEAENKYLLSV